MSDTAKELNDLVARIAREGALTPAAITQFDDLAKEPKKASQQLNDLNTAYDKSKSAYTRLNDDLKDAQILLKEKEAELVEYKKKDIDYRISAALMAHETSRRQEMRSIVSEVFRNFEVAKEYQKTVPMPPTYQGGPPSYATETLKEIVNSRPVQ